jgi:hypothetical protein
MNNETKILGVELTQLGQFIPLLSPIIFLIFSHLAKSTRLLSMNYDVFVLLTKHVFDIKNSS